MKSIPFGRKTSMSAENKCKLCKDNKADKTGSHFFPHFLLKRIDNVDGSTARDKEVGFVIGEKETTSYVGRAVLPEQYEEVLGELSDAEIKNMKNPSVENYIFCTDCENRFSKIEGEYSKTIDVFDFDNEYVNKIPKELAFLFWVSILWRASVGKKYGLILNAEEEELLRIFLDTHLKGKIVDINLKAIETDKLGENLSYKLIRCPEYPCPTFLLCHPGNDKPYFIMIDEYVISFYFNFKDSENTNQSFFGFEHFLFKAPLNTLKTGENILPIRPRDFLSCIKNIASSIANTRLKYYNWLFDEVHKKMGGAGNSMPIKIKESILERLASDEKKLGRKYTFDELTRSMYQEMKKYAEL